MSTTITHLTHADDIRLLIVSDDARLRSMLVRAFRLIGYAVEEAASRAEARTMLGHKAYDLLLLDLDLCQIARCGLALMQEARDMQSELLLILLSGHANLHSTIYAIRCDAADYLIKPLRFHEVADAVAHALEKRETARARLAAALDEALGELGQPRPPFTPVTSNPRQTATRPVLVVPPLELDRDQQLVRVISRNRRHIPLTEGETAVLSSLMQEPNHPLSCQQIVYAAWGYNLDNFSAGSVVRPYISRLRKKLESDPKDPELIQTVRGRGYQFITLRPVPG